MTSASLNQGSAFIKKQANVFSNKKQINTSKTTNMYTMPWLPDSFQEGVTTMGAVSLDGSIEAQKSNATLTKTEVNDQMVAELDILNAQYKTAITATNDAQNKYNASLTDYISRTNSLINKNSNKNIKLNDGTIGYMTNRGVFRQYDDITNTAGINGCPREADFSNLNFGIIDIDKHPSIISLGANKLSGTACGNEGTNIYVNKVISDADVKYLGCFTKVYGAMTTITSIDNYDDCKLYAMNNGYKYFGLVNANLKNQKVTCVVGNDKARITSKELGYIYNEKELITLGSGLLSALLTNEGQIVLLNQKDGTGKVNARMPNNVAANCQRGGAIRLDGATYGANCNSYTTTTYQRECKHYWRWFGRNYCWWWQNTPIVKNRFPIVYGNNVYSKIDQTMQNNTSNQEYSPITTIIGDYVQKGLSKFTTGINNSIFGDPAPGCSKTFTGYYNCGSNSRQLNASENGSVSMDCSDVVATCQFYLILQDDGDMCIYRGTGPNDNQGLIWASNTKGKQYRRGNPKTKAEKGKYGRNYIRVGEYLNQGEWIGSTNGSMQLMMTSDGRLVLYTIETYDSWVKLKNSKIASVNNDFVAVYELSKVGIPGNLGKMSYIDDSGILSEYPDSMIGAGKGYTLFNNINSPYNNISGPIPNKTSDECAKVCDSNNKCFGYVYDKKSRVCWPKNKRLLKQTRYNIPNTDFYLRNTKVIGANGSCDIPVINVESVRMSKYEKSGKYMNKDTLCDKFAHMEEMPILAYKKDFDEKKKISDNLATKINDANKILQARTGSQIVQTTQNTSTDTINNVIYNQTMDTKIPKAVEVTINPTTNAVNVETFENIDDMYLPSQRAKTVQFKNIDAIVEDSSLVVIQENYNYILWSILAVITTIMVVKTLRKQT